MIKSDFELLLAHEQEPTNVIAALEDETLPLILWGAGDVASAVKAYLERNHIFLSAVWEDNSTQQSFDGLPVFSLEDIKEKYHKFNVILGHSHYNLGDMVLKKEEQISKLFYFVSIFYDQYKNIPYKFVKENIDKYYATYQMLADIESRNAMLAYLNARINNNINYIQRCVKYEQTFFKNDIYEIGDDENYVDIGAFDGDTIRQFIAQCDANYQNIYAFEPEEENFNKLKNYIEASKLPRLFSYHIGTWFKKDILSFQGEQDKRSTITEKKGKTQIFVDALDNLINGKTVSLIKINFYQGVLETLMGAKKIIACNRPKLAIVVGFDEWALIKIPEFINSNFPQYKMYLRYNRCMPACLTLYAI